jgi:uncharacterized protein (DUF1499 family)
MRMTHVVILAACRAVVTIALWQPVTRQPATIVASRRGITLAQRQCSSDGTSLSQRHRLDCRRSLLGATAAAAVVALLPFRASAASAAECKTKPGALYAVRTCARYGIQKDGRLAGCLPSENCVSSSAIKSPAQFDAPWLFSPATRDADKAFEELVKAATASPELKIAETDPARRYLRATAPSQISNYKATDVDDVEIIVDGEKGLAFHRSASRESVFFFPPQNIYSVPLGDNGSNRGRLEALRKVLGWESTNPRPEEEVDSPGSYQALKFGM